VWLVALPSISFGALGVLAPLQFHELGLGAIGISAVWHLLSWVLGASEIWVALRLLGQPVSLTTAVVLESLGEAIKTVAFAVPGADGSS